MSSGVIVVDRWERAGRVAGYGAAAALTPYLVIKVSWVLGAIVGVLPTGRDLGLAEWVVINAVTVVMAAAGILVALALVRPWGDRLPARWLVAGSWLGAGFLVPLLPYAVAGFSDVDDGGMPAWEGVLIQAGFVGMGLGLAVALPGYVHRRWPAALAGRLDERRPPGSRDAWSIAAAAGLAAVWAAEAVADGRALGLLLAGWALAAAVAVGCLVTGRPSGAPRTVVMAVAWLGSGSLFAWSAWKLPLGLVVDLGVPVWTHAVGLLAGAAMLRTLLAAARQR